MKRFISVFLSVFLIFTLVGCGSSKISKKKLIEDLNSTDAAVLWNNATFDITDCEIVNETQNGENGLIYDCSITKKNENYEIIAQCSIEYIKGNDGWNLLNYAENEIDVTPISGVSEELIIKHIETKYADRENTTVTNITHDFSQENKTDYITAEYKCEQPYYSRNGQVTINAIFKNNEWSLSDSTESSNGEWKLQPLVGTWQFERGNHLVQYKILSIDEGSSTVSYQIRSTTNGTFWGDGSQRINDEQFSETMRGNFIKTNKKEEEHILICSATIYHNHFDFNYGLYVDKDSVYSYDDFYNRTYTAINVDKPNGTNNENTSTSKTYKIATKLDKNYVLNIENSSRKRGGNLELQEDSSNASQEFELRQQSNGYYLIINKNSGMALTAENNGTIENTNVCQQEINNSLSQQWSLVETSDNCFYIIEKNSGLYLDVDNAWTENGTNIKLFSLNTAYEAQKWLLIEQ